MLLTYPLEHSGSESKFRCLTNLNFKWLNFLVFYLELKGAGGDDDGEKGDKG